MESKMKRMMVFVGVLLMAALAMQSCKSNDGESVQPLVVERQECVLKNVKHPMTGKPYDIGVVVDVPTEGQQVLVDSIMAYLNKTLYAFFESGEKEFLPFDSVCSSDSRQLLRHYQEAYQKFYVNDSTLSGHDFLEVVVAAQTDSYVTYEANWSFHGEGVETSQDWKTSRKSDGQSLEEVVCTENMIRFLEEHPDKRSEDVWADIQHKMKDSVEFADNYGLLGDSVAHQHCYANGIFETVKYDLKAISPYLSKETKDLVGGER